MPESNESERSPAIARRLAATTLILICVGLSWSGSLEQAAEPRLQATLQRALVTAAIARGLNGVISVAQGTEIAIQPVGIGITIAAGEILDPLNDLIERFSWLALAASASLATQLLLSEVFANNFINGTLTAAGAIYLLAIWLPGNLPGRLWLLRATALLIFARFLFTIVILVVSQVDQWLLVERQQQAMSVLTQATQELDELQSSASDIPTAQATQSSVLERFEAVIDTGRQALDIESQLSALKRKVEASITELINLMAVFLVQTLVLPIGSLLLAFWSLRSFLRWLTRDATVLNQLR